MFDRCYYSGYQDNNPTYRGCTVAEEWHNFQNFAKWYEDNYIEGYQLDKDIKVEGNKVYGPDTCMFISKQENVEETDKGLKVHLAAQPVKGRANKALIELLSKHFNVKKINIKIIKGLTSNKKEIDLIK